MKCLNCKNRIKSKNSKRTIFNVSRSFIGVTGSFICCYQCFIRIYPNDFNPSKKCKLCNNITSISSCRAIYSEDLMLDRGAEFICSDDCLTMFKLQIA